MVVLRGIKSWGVYFHRTLLYINFSKSIAFNEPLIYKIDDKARNFQNVTHILERVSGASHSHTMYGILYTGCFIPGS